ncbi:hypothetical protein AaE_006722 [Aphanomyces astaci]|uniref:Uncharacterized protein n=1 Tax=Aphanomyces astaci TaxID=112090 RepID=A0A6A5ADW9_APHAT|nr:hypothetical protein AaE_006722 [Aphanomyces astaci]
MRKLKNILPAARLRRLTLLAAETLNSTRWTSTHSMLKRYTEIKSFLGDLGDAEIDLLRLSPIEERAVDTLLAVLGDLTSITLALQDEECMLSDVRRIFDTVVEDYPDAVRRLGETADIVQYPTFESGVVKILSGHAFTLTDEEVSAVERLAVPVANQTATTEMAQPPMSLVQRALKKQRVSHAILLGNQAGDWRSSLLHYAKDL